MTRGALVIGLFGRGAWEARPDSHGTQAAIGSCEAPSPARIDSTPGSPSWSR